ncbi:hypothetical protein EWM64_g2406 [Hericium alpestre]|uniref:Major facilitator superfamily (MFS) profile domain-containing protein n=1 Tax=Hericium alpestre TaxID=135208 RepID=A0A4Z0A3L1_9AGAM|nr:hypothetical protein EWM64_g2406 [Hericium alpestre]
MSSVLRRLLPPASIRSFLASHPSEIERHRPWGLEWRSSIWFVTLVVGMGITTDLIVYSVVIPVFPFELEKKGYNNVSALVGYLLFAFSGGLVFSTPPIAWHSEKYNSRQMPLILGLTVLLGSQVMLMEAPTYWVMALARVIQGISSSMVWVVGLALLCDVTPEALIGSALLVGPPVGGALYSRLGFRAPFIFSILITFVDVVGRLLIIEPRDARLWGVDPAAALVSTEADEEKSSSGFRGTIGNEIVEEKSTGDFGAAQGASTAGTPVAKTSDNIEPSANVNSSTSLTASTPPKVSLLQVMTKLMMSSRAVATLINILIYGTVYSSQETVLALHLQRVWGLNASKAGLVFIAAVVPVLFSSPLAGWLSDRQGAEWITVGCLVLALPWWGVIMIEGKLALFIMAFAIESFFTAAVLAPLTRELAVVTTKLDGVGYAHSYGAYNLAYGIGSCVGPIIGSQIFQHVGRGWMTLNVLAIGMLCVSVVLALVYTDAFYLLRRSGHTLPRIPQSSSDTGLGDSNGDPLSVVGLGITTDLIVYSVVIPVFPFELERRGYRHVPALVGYLLFAFSGGLVFSTPPIAWYSERYNSRQMPLILGLIVLLGAQVMLMEAPRYWVMALARVIQGISSSVVWVVGLALLCDVTPEALIGRQLGMAMAGLPVGLLIGPPVGGALYGRFGVRAPFIFSMIVTFVDLVGRLLIIEPRDARLWGVDPAVALVRIEADEEKAPSVSPGPVENEIVEEKAASGLLAAQDATTAGSSSAKTSDNGESSAVSKISTPSTGPAPPKISFMQVMWKLMKSLRAVATVINVLIFGTVYSSQETVLTLHLEHVWGLSAPKAGLVFIAAVVPVLFSTPLAGWLSDRWGSEWVILGCLLLALPWWGIVIIEGKLALFIVAFAIESFFTAAVLAPLTRELAVVTTKLDGVGYAHSYGAYNLAYGIGSCVGPIVGGEIYQHIARGWMALNVLAIGLLSVALVLAFIYTGDRPLFARLLTWIRRGKEDCGDDRRDLDGSQRSAGPLREQDGLTIAGNA